MNMRCALLGHDLVFITNKRINGTIYRLKCNNCKKLFK